MKSFKLVAKLDGFTVAIKEVVVDFSMQSMKMGFNAFHLTRNKGLRVVEDWQTSILLPICVSKQTDWLMNLSIRTEDKEYKAVIPLTIK
ncbi:hypothetical protein MNBD_GAMMA23-140 [hydrothermal vent metagenome]|uniref:Uncharacterized protein n=1 Tax=hydrothermal vent metagenome TaxID=652676 RepID=A0A3B0ZUU3_9ZZZZ